MHDALGVAFCVYMHSVYIHVDDILSLCVLDMSVPIHMHTFL